ncbi:MAG TPA: C-terminal binding protein [Chthonomonadaceae bacterium]|nr:C-terminal binding protein [Chthonomonadaceae bacterium]
MPVEYSESPKIVLSGLIPAYSAEARETLARSGVPFAVLESEAGDPVEAMVEAEVLMVAFFKVTADVIARLKRCRTIIRMGVGFDNIDVEAATGRGITVCNVPDFCTAEVADHALSMSLSLARALPYLDRCVRDGIWKAAQLRQIPAFSAMRFGVLGCGRIGRIAIERARAFGFELLACDPYIADGELPAGVRPVSLTDLLEQSDILSLHVPLTRETERLLNAERLARMKATAILVNTSRGPVIDLDALVDALQSGRLAAAGLDVVEPEPLPLDHPLLALPNVLLSPHYAWHSEESAPRRYKLAVEEALRAVRGEPLRNSVNGMHPAGR